MTQYKTELINALKKLREEQERLNPPLWQSEDVTVPDTTLNIFVTDMTSESDVETLTSALLSMQGVNRVKATLSQKRLTLSYNPKKTTPQSIGYKINKLGYHHIGRG